MDCISIVSGGGTGMGREIALRLARSGKTVLIAGRRPEPLAATCALAPADHMITVATDLSTPAGVEKLVAAVPQAVRIEAFVAAAGGQGEFRHGGATLADIDIAWDQALRKNLFSSLLPIEALLDRMADRQGRVVLITSTSALDGRGGPYATAKAAMHGYMMDLCQRLAPRGITVNVIAPGFVRDTEFFAAGGYPNETEMEQQVARRTPLQRVGTPADIAACAMWLLGPEGDWTTGQVISINGGTIIG